MGCVVLGLSLPLGEADSFPDSWREWQHLPQDNLENELRCEVPSTLECFTGKIFVSFLTQSLLSLRWSDFGFVPFSLTALLLREYPLWQELFLYFCTGQEKWRYREICAMPRATQLTIVYPTSETGPLIQGPLFPLLCSRFLPGTQLSLQQFAGSWLLCRHSPSSILVPGSPAGLFLVALPQPRQVVFPPYIFFLSLHMPVFQSWHSWRSWNTPKPRKYRFKPSSAPRLAVILPLYLVELGTCLDPAFQTTLLQATSICLSDPSFSPHSCGLNLILDIISSHVNSYKNFFGCPSSPCITLDRIFSSAALVVSGPC